MKVRGDISIPHGFEIAQFKNKVNSYLEVPVSRLPGPVKLLLMLHCNSIPDKPLSYLIRRLPSVIRSKTCTSYIAHQRYFIRDLVPVRLNVKRFRKINPHDLLRLVALSIDLTNLLAVDYPAIIVEPQEEVNISVTSLCVANPQSSREICELADVYNYLLGKNHISLVEELVHLRNLYEKNFDRILVFLTKRDLFAWKNDSLADTLHKIAPVLVEKYKVWDENGGRRYRFLVDVFRTLKQNGVRVEDLNIVVNFVKASLQPQKVSNDKENLNYRLF